MPGADIRIVKKGAPPEVFLEVVEAGFVEVLPETPWKVVVQEGAMSSGRSSVDLAVELPDAVPARYVLLRTSLSVLASIVGMARAAFPHEFKGGPLEVNGDPDAQALAQAEALVTVTAGLADANGISVHEMAHAIVDMVRSENERRAGG